MSLARRLSRFLSTSLMLGLAACGGGDGETPAPSPPPPPPPPGTVIGPAGGTVTGPNGARVVIPAGALATDTRINIALVAAGARPLPAGFAAAGPLFEFTPDGTTFAVPVTVTVPYDPALVPTGRMPVLYKTNSQNQWIEVSDWTFDAATLTGTFTSFTGGGGVIPPLQRNDPERSWEFSTVPGDGGSPAPVAGGIGTALPGELVNVFADFGPARWEVEAIGLLESDPRVGIAHGELYSTPDGVTYMLFAEAPDGLFGTSDPIGSGTKFKQSQSFIKRSASARLTYTITRLIVQAFDANPIPEDRSLLIEGGARLVVKAHLNESPENDFHSSGGNAFIVGHGDEWVPISLSESEYVDLLWQRSNFDFATAEEFISPLGSDQSCPVTSAHLELIAPITHTVDLTHVPLNVEFTLEVDAAVAAINRRGGGSAIDCDGAFIGAMLRDPSDISGASISFSGLEPTNRPVLGSGVPRLVQPSQCVPGPGPDPASGVLQFSAANYSIDERATVPAVVVTRSGGSRGAVTATFTTSDGSGIAGADYTAANYTVFFSDGEEGSRLLRVPILQDVVSGEPDRTVNLALSQPGGCAALGDQTTAVLTIVDDDIPPPPPSFTVGGTVTGLVGEGLTLEDHRFQSLVLAPGNGTFTFPQPTQSGQPYNVIILSQPSNPIQVCSISNGSGTMGNANVTHIAVNCAAPPSPGGLDPGFGGGTGKVSTAVGGDETDMLLLPDGKILMVGGSSSNFVMARYLANGTPDDTFGINGEVTTDIAGGIDAAFGAALLSDGDIIVVGTARVGNNDDFAVVRYDDNGAVDTAFGTQGKTTTDFFGARDRAYAVAVFPDDSFVVGGETLLAPGGNTDFAVARYTEDGVLDNSFGGGDGKVDTDIAGRVDLGRNVLIEATGTILVSGPITMGTSPVLGHAGIARYSASGELDGSFAAGGRLALPSRAVGDGLALQADGQILAAGNVVDGASRDTVFAVTRIRASGQIDTTFGSGGDATAMFSINDDYGRDVTVDAQGRILVSGQSSNLVLASADFAVARFTPAGALDTSLDGDGKFAVDFFNAADSAENIAIQPDGKILLGGFAVSGVSLQYGLVRINP